MITDPDGKPYAHNAEQSEAAKRGRMIENARAHHAQLKDANARAERAEAELSTEREKAERYRLATLKLDAELATERARLDWLEDNSVCYHVCIDRQPDGYSIHNSPPSLGSVRAAIDAAMKEDSK